MPVEFFRHPIDAGLAAITGRFGDWYSVNGVSYQHRGVDYGCPVGTPVYAPAPGSVEWFANDGSFGQAVNLRLLSGAGWTIYAHLSSLAVVYGQAVETGMLIGYSGNTGTSTGPHLHWQWCMTPWYPTDITQSRDPLEVLDETMMSPEERQRLEALEWLFGGPAQVAVFRSMGIRFDLQVDQQNTAIFQRINEHRLDGHGLPVMP